MPSPIGPPRSPFDSHVALMRAFRARTLLSKSSAEQRLAKPGARRHSAAAFGEMLSDLG